MHQEVVRAARGRQESPSPSSSSPPVDKAAVRQDMHAELRKQVLSHGKVSSSGSRPNHQGQGGGGGGGGKPRLVRRSSVERLGQVTAAVTMLQSGEVRLFAALACPSLCLP